jgi:hypothetical protein
MRPSSAILLELPLPEDPKDRKRLLKERAEALRRETWERSVQRWGRRSTDVGNWCYGGALKLVQFPAYALDLLDRYGKPDHSKIGPFVVSQEFVLLEFYDVTQNHHPLQPTIVIVIAVLSFASASLMRLFIQKSKMEITSANTTSIESKTTRTIDEKYIEAHYTADGIPAFSVPAIPGAVTLTGEC